MLVEDMYETVDKEDIFRDELLGLLQDSNILIGKRNGMFGNWTGILNDGKLLICYGNDSKYVFETGILHEMAHLISAREDRFHLPEFGLIYPKSGISGDMFSFKLSTFGESEDAFTSVVIIMSAAGRKELDVLSVQYLLTQYCFPGDHHLHSDISRIVDLSSSSTQLSDKMKSTVYDAFTKQIICNSMKFTIEDILETWNKRIGIFKEIKNRPDFEKLVNSHVEHTRISNGGLRFY